MIGYVTTTLGQHKLEIWPIREVDLCHVCKQTCLKCLEEYVGGAEITSGMSSDLLRSNQLCTVRKAFFDALSQVFYVIILN